MQTVAMDNQHIPLPTTSLVGRSDELARLTTLLMRPDVHLVTLLGPGGVGKTRLALQIAQDIDTGIVGPVRVVLLANTSEGDEVLPAIARVLGTSGYGNVPLLDEIIDAIGDRPMLLLLDNIEQVSDHMTFVSDLIRRCPRLTILVTSRVMLHLSGEHVFQLDPLPTTSPGLDELAPATALFADRARLVQPDLELTRQNIDAIDDICRRVDGLPLAIELAAARTRFLSPVTLRDRLTGRLPMLIGGPRDAPERHRTIRATLEWSFDLLSPEERTLFRRLGVAANGLPYDAVEPICNPGGDLDGLVDETLAALVDHSLVRIDDRPETGPRVRLLHTVREFAEEQLERAGETDAILRAHAHWYARLVINTPSSTWRTASREIGLWTRRHLPDTPTFSTVLQRLIDMGECLMALEMATQLTSFWVEIGQIGEAHTWLNRLAPYVDQAPMHTRAAFHRVSSIITLTANEVDRAWGHATRALELAEQMDNYRAIGNAQNMLGTILWIRNEPEEGERYQRAAAETMRQGGDPLGWAMFLAQLAERMIEDGQAERAAPLFDQALPIISRERPDAVSPLYGVIAFMHVRLGQFDKAGPFLARSLEYHQMPPHQRPDMLSMALMLTAEYAAHQGQAADGARLLATSLVIAERIGLTINDKSMEDVRRAEAALRREIDAEAYTEAWNEGRQLSIPAAIDLALRVCATRMPARAEDLPAALPDDDLTPREREVLRLLAAGKSNAEIAEELYISQRTVTTHLTRLYAKLDVSSRTAAIHAAMQMGIIGPT